jgi:hypothetical protein
MLQGGSTDGSSFGNSPLFDLDLGAFELVDSGGMSAEALLSQEDPVIFHVRKIYEIYNGLVIERYASSQRPS